VFSATGQRGIWGIGIGSFQNAFSQDFEISTYVLLSFGKIAALICSVTVRAPGDLLEPVLISGGCLGGMIGKLIAPESIGVNPVQVCIILGMSGLFAATFGFPLTPVVITLELTGVETYSLILPVCLCCLTAITASERMTATLLHEIMEQDDINLHDIYASASPSTSQDQSVELAPFGDFIRAYSPSSRSPKGSPSSPKGRPPDVSTNPIFEPMVKTFSDFAQQISPRSPKPVLHGRDGAANSEETPQLFKSFSSFTESRLPHSHKISMPRPEDASILSEISEMSDTKSLAYDQMHCSGTTDSLDIESGTSTPPNSLESSLPDTRSSRGSPALPPLMYTPRSLPGSPIIEADGTCTRSKGG